VSSDSLGTSWWPLYWGTLDSGLSDLSSKQSVVTVHLWGMSSASYQKTEAAAR